VKSGAILVAWVAFGTAAPASAVLLPPSGSRALPSGVAVLDDGDVARELRDLAAGTPRLLLPVFTRCRGTCPVTAVVLKNALASAAVPFRVVVLSFDEHDTARDLKEFRERLELPAAIVVVRSGDAAATRSFLDGLGFRFRRASEGGFDHPNQTFVFSPDGAWSGTFAGSAFPKDDLEAAWRRAATTDHPAPLQRFAAWLVRPEAWIAIASAGFATAGLAIASAARRSRRPARSR
jgi:cytochrome oxidase Cu insertion factor (SCO1/SenC/PrrC family)